jgi:metal-responsive CopG/Arc/MetJ family transcriptional regulator
MSKKSVRINVTLTEKLFQRLKDYAEAEEITMSEVLRDYIRKLPMKKKSSIE